VWDLYELKSLPKKRTGRPRIFNDFECKRLKRSILRNKKTHRQTLSQIHLNYVNKTHKTVSTQTIRKELAKESLHSRISRLSPLISDSNKEKRYLWTRTYENWTVEDFKKSSGQTSLPTHNLELQVLGVYSINHLKSSIKTALLLQFKKALVACFGGIFTGLV
jgi:hypothetical protein